MTDPMREYSRRQFLKVTAAAGAAVGVGGFLAACSAAVSSAPAASSPRRPPPPPAPRRPLRHRLPRRPRQPPTGTFNWMTWGDHSYPAQLDAIAASEQHQGQQHAVQRQHRRLHEAQAGRRPARHGVGRRAVGAPLLRVRADRGLGHQFARGRQAALLDRPVVPDLDQAGRLPRLPVRVVAGPDLLRPGEGLAGPRFVGGPARPEVQEAGRRRGPAGRDHGLHGQVRRRRQRLQHDPRRDRQGQGGAQASSSRTS